MASATTFPPGGTIIQVLKRSFTDVPVDAANGNAVSTSEFLEAAESLTTIFGAASSGPSSSRKLVNAVRCPRFRRLRPRQE